MTNQDVFAMEPIINKLAFDNRHHLIAEYQKFTTRIFQQVFDKLAKYLMTYNTYDSYSSGDWSYQGGQDIKLNKAKVMIGTMFKVSN